MSSTDDSHPVVRHIEARAAIAVVLCSALIVGHSQEHLRAFGIFFQIDYGWVFGTDDVFLHSYGIAIVLFRFGVIVLIVAAILGDAFSRVATWFLVGVATIHLASGLVRVAPQDLRDTLVLGVSVKDWTWIALVLASYSGVVTFLVWLVMSTSLPRGVLPVAAASGVVVSLYALTTTIPQQQGRHWAQDELVQALVDPLNHTLRLEDARCPEGARTLTRGSRGILAMCGSNPIVVFGPTESYIVYDGPHSVEVERIVLENGSR